MKHRVTKDVLAVASARMIAFSHRELRQSSVQGDEGYRAYVEGSLLDWEVDAMRHSPPLREVSP